MTSSWWYGCLLHLHSSAQFEDMIFQRLILQFGVLSGFSTCLPPKGKQPKLAIKKSNKWSIGVSKGKGEKFQTSHFRSLSFSQPCLFPALPLENMYLLCSDPFPYASLTAVFFMFNSERKEFMKHEISHTQNTQREEKGSSLAKG